MMQLGRIHIRDKRDRKFLIPKPKRASRRTTRWWYDSRRFLDQAETPTCVGHAWSHWLLDGLNVDFANPHGIYAYAQLVDEWPDDEPYEGTSVRAGAKVLQDLGFISEYLWTFDLDRLIETLLELGPVVVGTDWFDDMFETDARGFVHVAGGLAGGHAYGLTGVDTVNEYFRIKNSWSRKWGLLGRARITFADMRKLIRRDGEVCLATQADPLAAYPRVLRVRKGLTHRALAA